MVRTCDGFINCKQLDDKWHAGIGFVINAKYNNYTKAFNCINRTVSLSLTLPSPLNQGKSETAVL